MKELWLQRKRKVFLANFTDSLMTYEIDDEYTDVKDFWRKKTYVKNEEMLLPYFEREFPEPYQVAQYYCGGTWNDFNAPFTIQVGFCNLDCRWCYVPKELKRCEVGAYFSAREIIDIWKKNEDKGVLRISGGEAFLAPEFLIEVGKELKDLNEKGRYLWIDTNLLGNKYIEVTKCLSELNIPFGICGCFKGFDETTFEFNTQRNGNLYNLQFENANKILNNIGKYGELFFYVPEIIEIISEKRIKKKILNFLELLRSKIHQLAPLRTTVLIIHEYDANIELMKMDRLKPGYTRELWLEILKELFTTKQIWLPQYQINIKGK